MEILFEPLLQAVLWVGQVVLEMVLQIFGEALCELGLRSLAEPFRRPNPAHPTLAALGYLLFGMIAGGLSLRVVPDLFIDVTWLRWVNLLLTPAAAGLAMSAIGGLRRKRGQQLIRLDSYSYGFVFAFGMALVRAIWGH